MEVVDFSPNPVFESTLTDSILDTDTDSSQNIPVRKQRSRSELRWQNRSDRSGRLSSLSRFESKQERDKREKIEKENEILLRKILDCHHGIDRGRTSCIPGSSIDRIDQSSQLIEAKGAKSKKKTSHQINTKRQKQKTDYENLLLLQKIQNVKPSNSVRKAFC